MSSGHLFAMGHSARNLSATQRDLQKLSGISYLQYLQSIGENDYESILQQITVIKNSVNRYVLFF